MIWYAYIYVCVDMVTGDDLLGCTATFPGATSEQQRRLLMLYHPEPAAPSEEQRNEFKHFKSYELYKSYYVL